jgi:hypothetical protein
MDWSPRDDVLEDYAQAVPGWDEWYPAFSVVTQDNETVVVETHKAPIHATGNGAASLPGENRRERWPQY